MKVDINEDSVMRPVNKEYPWTGISKTMVDGTLNKEKEEAFNEEIKRLDSINQTYENELKKIKNEMKVLKNDDKPIIQAKLENIDEKVKVLDKKVSDIQNSLNVKESVVPLDIPIDKLEDGTSILSNVKSKTKKKKITKDMIQQNIIEEFESDYRNILDDRINSGLDLKSKACKRCDYETFSEGKLRHHKAVDHNIKETKDNIIIGFNNDVNEHLEVIKAMGDNIYGLTCSKCEFKTHSKGLLMMHTYSNHQ